VYHLVILEDNKEHVDLLVRLLENFPEKHRFQTIFFLRPESFITHIKEQGNPDIFLTDIDFGENSFNGIQLVSEQFQPGNITQVIYVTGFINYCTRVYETEHIYFLTKPVKSSELYNALVRAINHLDQAEAKSISLSVNGCVIRILTDTIN
jgi:DNA-binding LytR/AlgR family response regulator